jgi:hypothetical protein
VKIKTVEIEGKKYALLSDDGSKLMCEKDGADVAFDVAGTADTIKRLNGEAKSHRERAEAAEASLKPFEGLDAKKAREALQTVANLDSKQLVDAGKVEEVRQEAIRATEEKYKPIESERDTLRSELYNEKIGGAFARSKFIADKIAVPADLIQATFGKHFELKDGAIVAKDASGNPIYSDANPGKPADFEEALSKLINQYPQKDAILKGSQHQGGGAQPPGGGNPPAGGGGGNFAGSNKERHAAVKGMFPELPDN